MRESHVERTSLDLAVALVVGARLDPGPRSTERDEELREQVRRGALEGSDPKVADGPLRLHRRASWS